VGAVADAHGVKQTRVEPVLPGVPSGARRPGVLCLAPAWSLTLGGLALAVLGLGTWRELVEPPRAVEFWGIVITVYSLLVAGESSSRTTVYARLSDRIGDLYAAWRGLEQASGLSWAVERNLTDAENAYRLLLSPEQKESIGRIHDSLREIAVPGRPVTIDALRRHRQERYHAVWRINRDIIRVFGSQRLARGRAPMSMCRMDPEGLVRLNSAMGEWERALAAAMAAVPRWPVLTLALGRCDVLVKDWWVHVLDDPYHRDPDDEREPRRTRAHREAERAVEAVRDGVACRSLGHPTWRALLLRMVVGRRALEALDREKDLIR
jgi:hypothetical protein